MAKKVRMADIAGRLDVSTVTVSKALSGQNGVSEKLRAEIIKTAEEMGYRLPAEAKKTGTKTRESYNIGVVVSESYITKYSTFYWELYQILTAEAAKRGSFIVLEVLSGDREVKCDNLVLLQEKKVSALLVLGKIEGRYLQLLREKADVPVLFVDFYDRMVIEDCVVSNGFYGMYYLTNYLFNKGHRDLCFVGSILATDSIMDRFLGFQKSVLEHGQKLLPEQILPDRESARMCYDKIALPKKLPSAFVCNCDETAAKVIKSLRESGLRVPDDVSVVGYDDYLYPGLCDVPLTTYSVNMQQMAEDSIELILKKIKKEPYTAGMHVVEGRLVERESVAQK